MATSARSRHQLQTGLILLLVFGAIYFLSGREVEDFTIMGIRALNQGRTDQAITLFKKAIEKEPTAVEPNFRLGWIYRRAKKFTLAVTHLKTAATTRDSDPQIQDELGLSLLGVNNLNEAEKALRRAVYLKGDNAAYHNHLGMCLSRMRGRDREAINVFQKAMSLDKNYASPYINIGWHYFARNKFPLALQWYLAAYKLKPKSKLLLFNISNTYRAMNQVYEYKKWLAKAKKAREP